VSPRDAKIDASPVLTRLARLLRSDKAGLFDRIARTLLAEEGLDKDYVRYASERAGNLSLLLGIHDCQGAHPQHANAGGHLSDGAALAPPWLAKQHRRPGPPTGLIHGVVDDGGDVEFVGGIRPCR
jgi:hypothetical protein